MSLTAEILRVVNPSIRIEALTVDRVREIAPHIVTKPETFNYRLGAPEPGGLFDPQLFGAGSTGFARIPLAVPMVHPLLELSTVGARLGRDAASVSRAVHEGVAPARALVDELAAAGHEELILRELLVLPPDLRPLRREGDRFFATGFNVWYRRVMSRNSRLARLLQIGAPDVLLQHEYGELGLTILGLFTNHTFEEPRRDEDGEVLPSLYELAGGAVPLYRALTEIAARTTDEPLPADLRRAQVTLRTLGFDLRPRRE